MVIVVITVLVSVLCGIPCPCWKICHGLVLVCVLVIHEEGGNELNNVDIGSIDVCDPCVFCGFF